MREKAYELRQKRAELVDEAREIVERAEKDNRAMKPEELERYHAIIGNGKKAGDEGYVAGEAMELATRISQIERVLAVETVGAQPTERRSAPLPHEDPAVVGKKHRYSLMKAARCLYEKRDVDGLEGEVSEEIAHRSQKTPLGFLMPYRTHGPLSDAERRNLDSTTGAGSVPTILDKDWIELLRNAMKVKQAGAREFMDLQGKFAIPRQNAAGTAYWVAESTAVTGSNQTLDQVLFTPKTVGAYTDISRRFFELTMLDSGEEFVKEDLTAILARAIDLAALNGSGTSAQPLGILQNTGITSTRTVSNGTNGGAPTWAPLVEMYTIVKRGNAADLGEFSYISNADVEGTLATTAKIGSTFPVYLLDVDRDPPLLYNKKFYSTQQMPSNLTKGSGTSLSAMVAGIWNQLILAYWSGIDMLVDPYTGSSSGTIRIVALQDMDIQVRHNEAFSVMVDIITNQSS